MSDTQNSVGKPANVSAFRARALGQRDETRLAVSGRELSDSLHSAAPLVNALADYGRLVVLGRHRFNHLPRVQPEADAHKRKFSCGHEQQPDIWDNASATGSSHHRRDCCRRLPRRAEPTSFVRRPPARRHTGDERPPQNSWPYRRPDTACEPAVNREAVAWRASVALRDCDAG